MRQHDLFREELKKFDMEVADIKKIPKERTTQKIFRESLKILLLSALISSFGGIAMESVSAKLLIFLPLLIMLPAMNDLIGDFGSIIASKFTTMLYLGHIKRHDWWTSKTLQKLLMKIFTVATLSAIYMSFVAYLIANAQGFPFNWLVLLELSCIAMICTILMISILFVVCIAGGLYVHKQGHDPDNYLIPLATGLADLGSMLLLAGMLHLLF